MRCEVHDLGLTEYDLAWSLQEAYAAQIADGTRPPTLLLLEHPHVYTFGTGGNRANLLLSETQLKERGIGVRWVDRGGDVTYHGPGQLVGYPLIPLGKVVQPADGAEAAAASPRVPRADYVGYVRQIEQVLIQALQMLGIQAHTLAGQTGVWVDGKAWSTPAKIAAIGVKVDANGVTQHGFALNVNPDMSYWQGIVACGLKDAPAARLADLLDPLPDHESIRQAVINAFGNVFHYQMVET